jgi:hypothetical protein
MKSSFFVTNIFFTMSSLLVAFGLSGVNWKKIAQGSVTMKDHTQIIAIKIRQLLDEI